MKRFTLASLLVLIGLIAVGMAAMRSASEVAAEAAFGVMLLALFVALLGAIVRKGEPAWVGFALFGWGYALMTFTSASQWVKPYLPTDELLQALAERLIAAPPQPSAKYPVGFVRTRPGKPYVKKVDGTLSPLTEADALFIEDALAQWQDWKIKTARLELRRAWCARIGEVLLTLGLALAGSVLGRLLADHRPAAPLSQT